MRRNRGSAFLMALIAVVILTAVVVTAASETRTVQLTQMHRLEERRAQRMAEGGILYALAQMIDVDTAIVSKDDVWAQIGTNGTQEIQVADGSFRIDVIDAGSLFNINTATQEQLELLPLSAEQIDALLDWREPDLQPRIQGAKDEYYENLSRPYLTKLRDFDTVDEILCVKGFTAQLLYEPQEQVMGTSLTSAGSVDDQITLADVLTVDSRSSNLTPLGEPKLNVNTASTNQMIQAGLTNQLATAITQFRNQVGTYSSWVELLQVPGVTQQNVNLMLDYLTLETADFSTGKVNINTASEQVLNLLPGMTPDVTAAIVSRQGTFVSLGDLASIPGMSLALLGQIAGSVTLSSEAFIVRVIGQSGSSQYALRAIVTIEDTGPVIKKVEKYPFVDAALRWGWEAEPTTQTVFVDRKS